MKMKKESHARFAVTLHSAKVMVVAHKKLVNVNNTYVIQFSVSYSFTNPGAGGGGEPRNAFSIVGGTL